MRDGVERPKAYLTGMLWVDLNNLSQQTLEALMASYTYPHPKEPDIKFTTLVFLDNGRVGIPSGDLDKAFSIIGHNFYVQDTTVLEPVKRPISLTGLTLRDYQETSLQEASEHLGDSSVIDKRSFNLSGEPSSGKSILLAGLLAELNVKTLIIAHLSMLTTQLFEEIKFATNADVKILTKGDDELADVNIATSQFISKNPDLWYKIKKHIGLIVVDEAESIASETTMRILQRAHARYRIAITATFTRSVDGRTKALTDMIGHKVVRLVNDKLLKPSVVVVYCDERFRAPTNKNRYKLALNKFFRDNESIDQKIEQIVTSSLAKDRQVLIATDSIEMQERYAQRLERLGIVCGIMNSKTKTSDRKEILEKYDSGDVKVLLGMGVLNAGLSIPKISTIVRVSTPSSIEKLEQLVGRGRRSFEGKEGFWFIDLVFTGFEHQANNRKKFYRAKKIEESWKVVYKEWREFEALI